MRTEYGKSYRFGSGRIGTKDRKNGERVKDRVYGCAAEQCHRFLPWLLVCKSTLLHGNDRSRRRGSFGRTRDGESLTAMRPTRIVLRLALISSCFAAALIETVMEAARAAVSASRPLAMRPDLGNTRPDLGKRHRFGGGRIGTKDGKNGERVKGRACPNRCAAE